MKKRIQERERGESERNIMNNEGKEKKKLKENEDGKISEERIKNKTRSTYYSMQICIYTDTYTYTCVWVYVCVCVCVCVHIYTHTYKYKACRRKDIKHIKAHLFKIGHF